LLTINPARGEESAMAEIIDFYAARWAQWQQQQREITLGNRIRAARERLVPPMTQENLGAHFGITKAGISKWERDETVPKLDWLPKLRSLLRVSFAWLLSGNGPPPSVNDSTVRLDDWLVETYNHQRAQAPCEPAAADPAAGA
jgi:transcriptional regulator with XRE-family HTH domain